MHGNEIGTVKLMRRFINHLHESKIPYGVELFVIPCVNPDGFSVAINQPDYFGGGSFGRFNANNVDLNRNFAVASFEPENAWHFGSERVSVFCGKEPLSEPESRMLAEFIKDRGISIFYSFHSRGREVMGNCNEMSEKLVHDYVEKTGYRYVSEEEWKRLNQTGTVRDPDGSIQ